MHVNWPCACGRVQVDFGEMSRLLLTGVDMRPERLREAGFEFQSPTLDQALAAIL